MGRFRSILLYVLPLFISSAFALLYSCYFSRTIDFWDSIVGIFLSLVAGIPFSLGIDGLIKSREETEKIRQDRIREKDILKFIKQEIEFNSNLIQTPRDIKSTNFHPLQIEMWDVLKSSGDLKLITNTELLNRITSAYDITRKVKHFEEKAVDDHHPMELGSNWMIHIKRARNFDKLLSDSLNEASQSITTRINKIIRTWDIKD